MSAVFSAEFTVIFYRMMRCQILYSTAKSASRKDAGMAG
jgi:hypothetical protein